MSEPIESTATSRKSPQIFYSNQMENQDTQKQVQESPQFQEIPEEQFKYYTPIKSMPKQRNYKLIIRIILFGEIFFFFFIVIWRYKL